MQRELLGYSLELFRQLILIAGCSAENFPCRSKLRIGRLPLGPSSLLTERCRGVDQFLESELQTGFGHDADGNACQWDTSKPYRVTLDGVRLGGEPHMPKLARFLAPRHCRVVVEHSRAAVAVLGELVRTADSAISDCCRWHLRDHWPDTVLGP